MDDELYRATAKTLLRRLRRMTTASIVPWSSVTTRASKSWRTGSRVWAMRACVTEVSAKFPTAAVVTLSFDTAWADLRDGGARVDDLFMPRPGRR